MCHLVLSPLQQLVQDVEEQDLDSAESPQTETPVQVGSRVHVHF